MSLADLAGVLWRRAPLFLIVVVMSAVAGVVIVKTTPPEYDARAVVLLIDRSQDAERPSNPYMRLTDSLSTTAQVAVSNLTDPATIARLRQAGMKGSSEVAWSVDDPSPILRVLVRDNDPDDASRGLDLLLGQINEWLRTSQSANDVSAEAMVEAQLVQRSPVTAKARNGARRGLVAFLAVGLGVAVWVSLVVDRRARSNSEPDVRERQFGAGTGR